MGHRGHAPALRRLSHVQRLDDFPVVITQKWKGSAESGTKRIVNFGWVDAYDGQLAIIDRQLFLKFDKMVQLHLAFSSPITPIKRHDQRELPRNLGKLDGLAVVIRKLKIWKLIADALIHSAPPSINRLWVALCHFCKKSFFFELLQ
jgi:hypothetical protein